MVVVSSLVASSSNELRLLLLVVLVIVSAESDWSGETAVLFPPPANSMPKRRMADFSLTRGAGRMKGSWEKESTFMKSWTSLSEVVVVDVVLSIRERYRSREREKVGECEGVCVVLCCGESVEGEEGGGVGPINRGRVGTDLRTIGSDPSQSEA